VLSPHRIDLRTWLTPKEAATALGVSVQTVIRRIDATPPQLTAVNVSAAPHRRRYRIDPRGIIYPR
jgi:hypothetical protein